MFSFKYPQTCEFCKYTTDDLCNFERHKRTTKHLVLSGQLQDVPKVVRRVNKDDKEIHTDTGEFNILPNIEKDQRDTLFIAGPQGSGKSVFSSNYIKDYLTKYTHNKFYLFTLKDKDEPLDELGPIRIKLNEDLIKKQLKLEFFKNSIVLFDDVDSISNKEIKKEVYRLFDHLLLDGRSLNITILITYHSTSDYKNTRQILNNVKYVVLFPKSGGLAQNNYMLKTYCGLNNTQVKRINKLDTRYCIIKKTAPMMVIAQKNIYLL